MSTKAEDPILCPRCGGANTPDAVFCANPDCRKALGDFPFAEEEIARATQPHERLADQVAAFIGNPYFIVVHAVWFVLWILANTGLVAFSPMFDSYPFGLLGIILSIEAVFITGFLLISQNRQGANAEKRSQLDYEVNVRTFREIRKLERTLSDIQTRVERIETGKGATDP